MNTNIEELRNQAEHYRALYRVGKCTRDEAKENIMPYLDMVNEKSKEIAKKYNQKPRTIGFMSYIR